MLIILLTIFCLTLAQSHSAKQYRSDYKYYRKTDSFYKFHIDGDVFSNANLICENEGSELMTPSSDEELYYVHAMVFKANPDIGNYVWTGKVFTRQDSAEIETQINISRLPWFNRFNWRLGVKAVVMTRYGELESAHVTNSLPFICKIAAEDVKYDPHCDVYVKDFEYNSTVKSCYKIPQIVYSWDGAYDECLAEGAHLVVLNSELEHQVVHDLILKTPPRFHAQAPFFLFAGIRAEKEINGSPVIFKTIYNQTLQEAGYAEWSENEPNNALHNEYCGTIFKNDGKYNDVYCSHLYAFICEKNMNE